jgi:hypothetical protein
MCLMLPGIEDVNDLQPDNDTMQARTAALRVA